MRKLNWIGAVLDFSFWTIFSEILKASRFHQIGFWEFCSEITSTLFRVWSLAFLCVDPTWICLDFLYGINVFQRHITRKMKWIYMLPNVKLDHFYVSPTSFRTSKFNLLYYLRVTAFSFFFLKLICFFFLYFVSRFLHTHICTPLAISVEIERGKHFQLRSNFHPVYIWLGFAITPLANLSRWTCSALELFRVPNSRHELSQVTTLKESKCRSTLRLW